MGTVNFGPGPATLVPEVEEQLRRASTDFLGTGLPVWSISHRSPAYHDMVDETIALVREVIEVPSGFEVLFTGGGATAQFKAAFLNLPHRGPLRYIESGHWSMQAIQAGKELASRGDFICTVVASSADDQFRSMPFDSSVPDSLRELVDGYIHYCPNETSQGTQLSYLPYFDREEGCVVIADMSSEITTRYVSSCWSSLDLIYAGTQKNLGMPGGLCLVIVRKNLLERTEEHPLLPAPLSYREQLKHHGALRNTVDTMALYSVNLMLKWIKENGGITGMKIRASERAQLLYDALDRSTTFEGIARREHRSGMNVTFRVKHEDPEYVERASTRFRTLCESLNIVGLKGHAGVDTYYGPHMRASLYNAMDLTGVERLVKAIRMFENQD